MFVLPQIMNSKLKGSNSRMKKSVTHHHISGWHMHASLGLINSKHTVAKISIVFGIKIAFL